ncbi:MAG: YdcF family protein [Clostridia bacterium]|nr:YdcF family protein [Clostridia bacterium]
MKRILHGVVRTIAVFFLFCGIFPLCFYGHLNTGNGALILFGIFAFLLSVFWTQLQKTIALRILRYTASGVLLTCFVCGFMISGFMIWFGYVHTPPADIQGTVVVLGCEIHGERPSRVLKARLDAALSYLTQHPETPVVVAGGVGDDEIYSEAYVMRKYLMENGIASTRIYCEEQSRDTKQNILYAGEIIRREGLPETMLIATDGFHQLRAYLHANAVHHPAYAIPVTSFTFTTFSMQPEYWVREILGILHFTLIA